MKQIIKKILRTAGLTIGRYSLANDQTARLDLFFKANDITCVLDVGANVGQFARSILDADPTRKVISFEALPDAHAALIQAAEKHDGRWIIAPRMALSATAGTAMFNVADNAVSSSLKPPSSSLADEGIGFTKSNQIEVEMQTLDTALADLGVDVRNTFLKLDVQGAELDVLRGATETMKTLSGILSEMNVTTLYDGQGSHLEVDDLIRASGFHLWDLESGFRSREISQLLQFDAVYFR